MPAPRPSGRMWVAAILLHFISLVGLSEAQRKVITVGGTLSFTGSLEGTAKGINQSYFMWKSKFDGVGIRVGDDMYDVAFYFENDRSCPDVIAPLLNHMLNESETDCFEPETCIRTAGASSVPDFLLGPASSALAEEVVKITEERQVITLHGTASMAKLYEGTFFNFGVLAEASQFSESILRKLVLRDPHLDSIAFLKDPSSSSADACDQVPSIVTKLNEELVRDIEVTELGTEILSPSKECTAATPSLPTFEAITNLIQEIGAAGPDVIMGCLQQATCEKLLLLCANSTFVPKALILPLCLSDTGLTERIGDHAKFVLGASQWDPMSTAVGDDGISAEAWVQWFRSFAESQGDCSRSLTGGNTCGPTVSDAAHYAALVALEFALQDVKDQSCASDVEALLARLDIDTFFGRIRFNSRGQSEAVVTFEQYDFDFVRHVVYPNIEATAPIIFPLPSFDRRECVANYGLFSCFCTPEGCPPCSKEHWNMTYTDCKSDLTRTVQHVWAQNLSDLECDPSEGRGPPPPASRTCEYIPAYSDLGIAILVFASLAAVPCFIILILVIRFRNKPVIRMSQVKLSVVIIIGAIMNILGTISLVGPNTEARCALQLWFLNFPFAIMFGGILIRLNRVYLFTVGNKKLKRFELPWYDAWVKLFVIVAVPVVILTVAQIIDPPQPVHFKDMRRIGQSCTMESSDFNTILIMYRLFLILVGIYYCVRLRSVVDSLSDMRVIAWATYNITVWTVIESMLQGYFTLVPFAQLILISHVSESLLAVILLYVPKLLNLKATEEELLYGSDSSQRQSSNDSTVFRRLKEEVYVLKVENRNLRQRVKALEEEKNSSPEDVALT